MKEKVHVARELRIEQEEKVDIYFKGGRVSLNISAAGKLEKLYINSDKHITIEKLYQEDYGMNRNWHCDIKCFVW